MRHAILIMCACSVTWTSARAQAPAVGRAWPAWQEGMMDMHFINTGKGDAAFFILPDGTTLLRDAGDTFRERPEHYDAPPVPDSSRRAGQWIARYIQDVHPRGKQGALDMVLITHFHGDHIGSITKDSPESKSGAYRLSGITDVAESVPIRRLVDRGWPDYDSPEPLTGAMMDNYRAFVQWQIEHAKMRMEQFKPGRNDQLVLQHAPEKYPDFEVRNIAASGNAWTGSGEQVRSRFPEDDRPSENNCSIAFRLRYGPFTCFDGGDMAGVAPPTAPVWRDMESAVAWVVGPVDVCVLNHHGYKDTTNAFFLSVLRPRVHVVSVYAASHPDVEVMRRLISEQSYRGPRDIFLTNGMWPGRRPNMVELYGEADSSWLVDRLAKAAASRGHIVVRVDAGGETYRVVVLDDRDERRSVLSVHGPYRSGRSREP